MARSIVKVLFAAILLILLPVILLFTGVLSFAFGPLLGIMIIVFFPIVLIGILIGYRNGKRKTRSDQPKLEQK